MGYACSPDTIKRVMEGLGYHRQVPRRKFAIRPANKPLGMVWCRQRLNWTYEDWLRVVWMDKSTFSTAGFGNRPWVTRKATQEYHVDYVDETFESGRQSKIVWGAFCGTLKSKLVFVPTKAKVDSSFYVTKIMYPSLVPFWHRSCELYGWTTVVEDGAPEHKGFSIRYGDLNGIETTHWPAQSPDLNLIEHLWLDMENELGETWGRIGDIATLEAALTAVWYGIPNERLESLIRSMPECNMYTCSGNCIQERSAGFPMFSLITLLTLISLIVLQPQSYIKAR